MKSKLGVTLLCIFVLCMFSGCGSKNYEKLLNRETPVTITVWHYYNGIQQTQFDEMVTEFNNTTGSEKGIFVEAYSKNSVNELSESVLASADKDPGADELPDIFCSYAETAYQIDKRGMLVDLSKYFTSDETDEYVTEYIQEGSLGQKGTLKIFPTAKSTEILMLNLTDWQVFAEESGVTYEDLSTWEGLAEVSEKYYQYTDGLTPDIPDDGRAFFGRDAMANYMIVGAKQLGHEFACVSEKGEVTVSADRETVRRLWENFYVPFVKGYYNAESRFRSDDVKIGTIIALIGSTTGATYYPFEVTVNDDYTYPIENVVLPVPNFEGCEPYIVQQGAGMCVMKSNEKTEYACTVFLKWFTESDRNMGFAVNSGYLPVKQAANDFGVIAPYCEAAGINETMLNAFETAIDEINSYTLYTSPPYDKAADVRDYLGDIMERTAKDSQAAARERIQAGENRESVLEEYTDDAAFEKWYSEFEEGFSKMTG